MQTLPEQHLKEWIEDVKHDNRQEGQIHPQECTLCVSPLASRGEWGSLPFLNKKPSDWNPHNFDLVFLGFAQPV